MQQECAGLPAGARLIYSNPLASPVDVADFRMEGRAAVSFPQGRLRLENILPAEEGQKANYLFWCPQLFPADIYATWEFWPLREPGLAMMFFSANGSNGQDLFSPQLPPRTGEYDVYHHGQMNGFHASYFRRAYESERAFHLCNLRKSYGLHLVAQGADPLPNIADARPPYRMAICKKGNTIQFYAGTLCLYTFVDDGITWGPLLGGGYIGFRQMAPLMAEYANLNVYEL